MNLFLIPEVITVKVEVSFDSELMKLLNRIVDLKERPEKLAALAAGLNSSTQSLEKVIAANPDPDPKD